MGNYLGNGIYNDGNNKWELAIRINKDDDQFYYNNAIWENHDLLNENIYDLSDISNSKYDAFNKIKTSKIMMQMNGHDVIVTLNNDLKRKTLYELFTTVNKPYTTDSTIENTKSIISPWGFNRTWQSVHNISFNIVSRWTNIERFAYVRLGLHGSDSDKIEGLGIRRLYYTNYDTNSGRATKIFYPCNLYVEYKRYLIKQNEKYYSVKDGSLTLLGIPADDAQKQQWFNDYGANDLKESLLTPNENGNKLIDSLDDKFEVRMMK